MTRYIDKVLAGEAPTAADWKAHLEEAHRAEAGMSPAAFADCFNRDGKNSYQWLVQGLPPLTRASVVDLACGDGFLVPLLLEQGCRQVVGIDMSETELSAARKKNLPGVTFIRATADATGLQSASADHVVCHMAFMLLMPIEPVVKELMRIIKPGGTFVAVLMRPPTEGFFARFVETVARFLNREFPLMAKPVSGDARTQSEEGLVEILAGFHSVHCADDAFVAHLTTPGVWDHLKNMYLIAALPPEKKAKLKEKLFTFFEAERGGQPTLALNFPVRRVVAVR